jgi:hypothetical protein
MSAAQPRFRRNNPHLPPVGNTFGIVQYKIIGTIESQQTVSTFTYQAAVPAPSGTLMTTLLNNISTNLRAAYAACLSSAWLLTEEDLDCIHRNDINGVFTTAHSGLTGGRGPTTLPTTVAIVINRTSNVKGQHGRGRVSLPAVVAADTTLSKISAAGLITALIALETAMMVTASDGINVWTPCIAERANVSPRLAIGSSALQTVVHDSLLGTIRRRKIGRGV